MSTIHVFVGRVIGNRTSDAIALELRLFYGSGHQLMTLGETGKGRGGTCEEWALKTRGDGWEEVTVNDEQMGS